MSQEINLSELEVQLQSYMASFGAKTGFILTDFQNKFTDYTKINLKEALGNIVLCGLAYESDDGKFYVL